ncbi:hypothetical protein ZIOFF_069623 [Zingiber officinale]|uniref:Uncharacterized protein n=1 Tax=Zingiber officinale TaxID=94328 RepID=A0A8J5CW20_ZINOF|nr:hypothetical protein ZIOFF_069623 [Zingiber officinale]
MLGGGGDGSEGDLLGPGFSPPWGVFSMIAFQVASIESFSSELSASLSNGSPSESGSRSLGVAGVVSSSLYNLNRAAQVAFPDEEILARAKSFPYAFLREKQAAHQLLDKWIITKDLPGEVEYALDFPWYVSLPRVEARLYLEQYGGGSDIWIGKTLYRMPLVNNDMYLELANQPIQVSIVWFHSRWYEEAGLGWHGVSRRTLLEDFFLAASCIFEPKRKTERLGWVQTLVFSKAISAYFGRDSCTDTMRQALILNFLNADDCYSNEHGTNRSVLDTIPFKFKNRKLSKQVSARHQHFSLLFCLNFSLQFSPMVIEDMSIQVNVPALAMEEVAPLAVSDVAMLAPEEIFHGKGNIKEEAKLTKEERKRRRANQKRRFRRLKVANL